MKDKTRTRPQSPNNPVAKNAGKFNKSKVFQDRKKEAKKTNVYK